MFNDLYEFGGQCDVIVRSAYGTKINGVTYAENEPYTILKDVFVRLDYDSTESGATAKTNITASHAGYPDAISISNVQLTSKICDLIATNNNNVSCISKYYEAESDGRAIYLPEEPIKDSVFIYYKGKRQEGFVVTDTAIYCDYFVPGEKYLVFYDVPMNTSYDFEIPHYPYFALDIIAKGNTNKRSENCYMKFPATALVAVPVFDLVNGSILNVPLKFICIYRNQKKPYFCING